MAATATKASVAPDDEDVTKLPIKARLAREFPRSKTQTVNIANIIGPYYRLTWVDKATSIPRQSKFLHVTVAADGALVIEDRTVPGKKSL